MLNINIKIFYMYTTGSHAYDFDAISHTAAPVGLKWDSKQGVPGGRKATIRPKRQFVPSDNSSQATIRPILKKRQFVPFVKSCNLSPI